MGIPSYFSYVLKNHKIIKKMTTIQSRENLFLDANSIIYDVIHENNEINTSKEINTTTTIYINVFNKIMTIIDKIKPNFTYISFDGVVPLAKMKQQKQRRYKSYITKKILKTNNWNTNAITPGTKFMNDLDDYLSSKFKENPNKIIFSGSKQHGEGEQKIFEYIRNNTMQGNSIIYGLDADLIMLSLLHLKFHGTLYLYRETKHFSYIKGIDPDTDYLFSMDEMGTQIHEIMNDNDKINSIENYCFLCFLCGNDFLPHFPSINIRNNGVQYLLEVYKKIFTNTKLTSIVQGKTINWSSFHLLCSEIGTKENELIHMNVEWKKKMASYSHPLTIEESLESVALKDLKRELYISKNIDKYYSFLFKNSEKDVCNNYLQMLEWTWYYYNGTCKNNYICYDFHCGPLFSSLQKYIPCFNEEIMGYDTTKLPSSISQLLYVLPYDDYHLIPTKDHTHFIRIINKEYINLTETNFPIHFDFCKFFWEGYVDFNYIDLKTLDNTVNKWNL